MELPGITLLAYLAVFGMAALDIFLPILPADGTIVAAGALTVAGDLELPLVILAGLAGAWTGDILCYHVGRRLLRQRPGGTHRRPASFGPLRRFAELRRRIGRTVPSLFDRHPSLLLITCRLIPGGRTAGALAAGRVAFSRRRFALVELGVATGWASYETLLGHLSARLLPDETNAGWVMPAAEIALFLFTLTLGVRLWRSPIGRRPPQQASQPAPEPSAEPTLEPAGSPSG